MNYTAKEPKEVKRNSERKTAIMKITEAFGMMLNNASEISHDAAKKKMNNFTSWMTGTVDGVSDLIIAEDNYMTIDTQEREENEKKREIGFKE